MASSFDELRAEVEQAVGRLKALVPKIQTGTKDQGKQANSEVQRVLKEADRNVRALENEARASAPSQRRALQDVITELKSDLNAVRARIQKANDASSRADLMTGKQKQDRAETETRDRMVAAADTAVRSTGKLAQAQNLLEESQDIGINVIDTMQQQRETMLRSTDKVGGRSGGGGGWRRRAASAPGWRRRRRGAHGDETPVFPPLARRRATSTP